MTGKLAGLTLNRDGTQNITVTVDSDFATTYDALKDKPVTVEIRKASKGRSKDANAFCWALCSEIGKALIPPQDKADIYRRAIKAVGVYTPAPVKADEVVGRVDIYIDNMMYKTVPLHADQSKRPLTYIYILKKVLTEYFLTYHI